MDFSDRFNEQFQEHFVNFMLRDSQFLEQVVADIEPEYFESEVVQRVVRAIKQHWDVEHAAPDTLIFQTFDDTERTGRVSAEIIKTLNEYADRLFSHPLQNRQFLLKQFHQFVRHQMFSTNILPAAEAVKRGDFEVAEQLMTEVFTYRPTAATDLGRHYTEDTTERLARRRQGDGDRFWLLIPELDRVIDGMGRGELFLWQSQRSSAGKSAAMAFCTRSFVLQGMKVLILSLEMSEDKYEDRLDMCIAGITKDGLFDRQRIEQRLRTLFRQNGDVWIKQFPGGLTKVSDLRRYTQMLENTHGFKPDVVVVDYLNELAPETDALRGDLYGKGKEVASHLRGWAVEDQIGLMSGIQSGRAAMEETFADMQHTGESLAITNISDITISINRTAEEAARGLTNLYVVKHRDDVARFPVSIRTDFTRMQFWTRGDE